MRTHALPVPSAAVLAAVLLFGARAQAAPASTSDALAAPSNCAGVVPPPPPTVPNVGQQPGFMEVASPPANSVDVPRNVELRLSGDVSGLDANPPTFLFELRAPDGSRVPLARTGGIAHALSDLDANATYVAHLEATDANPCPQCQPAVDVPFTTGATADHEPPALTGTPSVNVFVLPSAADAAKCGIFLNETHQVVVDFGPGLFPDDVLIDVAAVSPAGDVKLLDEQVNTSTPSSFVGDLGATLPVALGDPFVVAFVARDLAGNTSEPRVLRVRARNFADESKPRAELPALWCDLPAAPQVSVPATVPANGRVSVVFPFEEVPVALKAADGTETPLIPVGDVDGGHFYDTVEPLPAGQPLHVEALACPHCTCPGCDPAPGTLLGDAVTADAPADRTPPSPPKVVGFDEDADPKPSAGGPCHPDTPALLVLLEPGKDDVTAALDLRYDAIVSVKGGPAFQLGRGLEPLVRKDGKHVVRVDTRGLGRLLGEDFVLTLDAVDAAGNRAEATAENHVEAAASGCSSTRASAPVLTVGALLLAALRRRLRARE